MGSRAVADALELLHLRMQAKGAYESVLHQLLFAAPDIDADLFKEMIRNFSPIAERITLYGSSKDWALSASRYLHGDAPRAGQGGGGMVVLKNVDSIDMSIAGDDMLAHNYFSNSNSALLDLATLLWRNVDPNRRYGLKERPGSNGSVWEFRPKKENLPILFRLCTNLHAMNVDMPEEAFSLARKLGLENSIEESELASFLRNVLS